MQSIHCILDYIRSAMLKDRVGFARHLAGMLNRVGSATAGQASSVPTASQRAVQAITIPAGPLQASITSNEELEVRLLARCNLPSSAWSLQPLHYTRALVLDSSRQLLYVYLLLPFWRVAA